MQPLSRLDVIVISKIGKQSFKIVLAVAMLMPGTLFNDCTGLADWKLIL